MRSRGTNKGQAASTCRQRKDETRAIRVDRPVDGWISTIDRDEHRLKEVGPQQRNVGSETVRRAVDGARSNQSRSATGHGKDDGNLAQHKQ